MSLNNQLNALESTGLIRLLSAQPSIDYLFRHALIQEAAYRSLTKGDRTELHRVVGTTIEQLYPDRLSAPDLAARLAQHFDHAGDADRALHYYTLAGDAAYQSFANLEAIEHYTHAIKIAARTPVLTDSAQLIQIYTRRGRALEQSGQYERARDNYAAMGQVAHQRSDRSMELAALIANTTIHVAPTSLRNAEVGQALSTRALALAHELNDRAALAKIYWNLVLLHRHLGNMDQSLVFGEQSIALARELNLREQLAVSLNDILPSYWFTQQNDKAAAALDEAAQIFRADNNLPMLADNLSTQAMFNVMRGNYESALAVSDEAYQLSKSIGNLWNQSYSRYLIGYVYLERGEPDQAIEIMTKTIELGAQAGFAFALVQTQTDLGFTYALLGDYASAEDCARRALADTERLLPDSVSYPFGLLAYVSFQNGQIVEAQQYLDKAKVSAELSEANIIGFLAWLADFEISMANHTYDHVLESADQALGMMNSLGFRPFRSDVLRFKGQALLAQNKIDEAHELFQQARQIAEELGSRRSLWLALIALSELEAQRGHADQAKALRAEAREIVEYFLDHISDPKLRKSFLNLPMVRATGQ
ncbi:MAG TPA: tetratricopeptide repeat protein [Anaerolineae bacterium]|nr:tetratricopeptide repeat protein [Anaerolineae bacterium]